MYDGLGWVGNDAFLETEFLYTSEIGSILFEVIKNLVFTPDEGLIPPAGDAF